MKLIANSSGQRVDCFVVDATHITRSYLSKIIEGGGLFINGGKAKASYRLKDGDEIDIEIPEPTPLAVCAQKIELEIVYEDKELLVVNKAQGMVVHPAAGHHEGTLVNALMHHCPDELSGINGIMRPGIVHRIDKDTSGLLLVAKTNKAHLGLAAQLKEHSLKREYLALVHGGFSVDSGKIDAPIGRNPKDRKKMCVTSINAKSAVTNYKIIEALGAYTLISCRLQTGRTHQIRVHMSHIGHPVAGDKVYGAKKEKFETNGQLLHAERIGFIHPTTGEYLAFSSPLPEYFEKVLRQLRMNI